MLGSLTVIARDTRTLLRTALEQCEQPIEGSCFFAAELLNAALGNFWIPQGENRFSRIEGGDGEQDGGIIDFEGHCHGHYWVRAGNERENFVIDITADQFGLQAVLVLPSLVASDWYQPGAQSNIDAHVKSFGLLK